MKYISDIETNVIKTNYILNSDSSPDKNNVVNGIWFDDENRRVMVSRDLNSANPHWCEVLTVCDIPTNENYEYDYNYNYHYNYYEYSYNYEYSYEYNYEYNYEYVDVPVYIDNYVYEYIYEECHCELETETEEIPVYAPLEQERTFIYNIDVPELFSETEGYTNKITFAYTETIATPIEGSEADKKVELSTEVQISETISFTATDIPAKTEASFTKNTTLTTDYSYTEYQKAPNKTETELTISEVVYNSPYDTTVNVRVEDSSYNVTTNISTTTNIETEVTIDVFQNIDINVKTELTNITGPANISTEIDVAESEILTNINTTTETTIPQRVERFTEGSATAKIVKYPYTIPKLETETNVVINENDQNYPNLDSYVITEKTQETEKRSATLYYNKPIYDNETINVPTINDPDGLLSDQSANLVLNIGRTSQKNTEDGDPSAERKWEICNGALTTRTSSPLVTQETDRIYEGNKFRLFFGVDYPTEGEVTVTELTVTEISEDRYLKKELISNIFDRLTLTITKHAGSDASWQGSEYIPASSEYYTYSVSGPIGSQLPQGLEFNDASTISKEYTFYVVAFGEKTTYCTGITDYSLTAPGINHPFFCYASPNYNEFAARYFYYGHGQTLNGDCVGAGTLCAYYDMMNSGYFYANDPTEADKPPVNRQIYVDMIAPLLTTSEISKIYNDYISSEFQCMASYFASEFKSVAIVSSQEYEIVKDLPFNTIASSDERQIFVDTQQTERVAVTGDVDVDIPSVKIKGINIPNYKVTMNNFATEFSAEGVPVEITQFDGTVPEFTTEVSVNMTEHRVTVPARTEKIDIPDYNATIKSYNADFTYNYDVNISEYKSVEIIKENYPVNIPDYPVSPTPDNPLIVHDYPVNIPAGTIKESNVKVRTGVDYITEVDRTVQLTYEGPVTISEIIEFTTSAEVSTEFCREIPVTLTELVKTSNYNVTINENKVTEVTEYCTRLRYYTENSETEITFNTQDLEGLVGKPLFIETGETKTIITNAWINKNEWHGDGSDDTVI